jgi:flagellar hook-associated protein 3 FlgL
MRISTGQMFQQGTTSILNNQSATNQILDQLSSGKRVNTAGDDPVASIAIDNLKQKNTQVNQYAKNIDYANNHLSMTESKLGSADSLMTTMRAQFLQGINGSLTAADRQTVAVEMKASMKELLSIANTQDESGNYMFAGYKTNTQPFAFDTAGAMVYSGDSGKRTANVASGVQVDINAPGDSTFMKAPNAMGDYGVNYLAGQQGDFTVSSAKIVNPGTHIADTYTFNFIPNGTGVDLQVVNSAATVVTTVINFDANNPVTFNGIEVKLSGVPVAGDSFTMQPVSEVSIFDAFNQAIALLEDPLSANSPQGKSKLAQLLNDIDSGQNQVSIARSKAGTSLRSLESISTNHEEEKIVNSSALSLLEDLDYSAAITEFEKQKLALNAISSVFSQVGSTSLFDFIR